MSISKSKPKRITKEHKTSKTHNLVTSALKAISIAYDSDSVAPGLVISYVHRKGEFYVAICRYFTGNKVTVFNAYAISWESALQQCMRKFLEKDQVLDNLRKALR